MTVSGVPTQRQSAELLRCADLQTGIVAACIGPKFVDFAEVFVERLIVGKGRKAAIAHRLIPVQLHLIWLMYGACADIIHSQRTARAEFAFQPQTPLQKVRSLQRSAGKGVQVDGQRTRWSISRQSD